MLPPDPASPDGVQLGERKAQGWVNFRWPYSQYELFGQDRNTGKISGTGTCESISFVSRGTVFQINRLKWGHGSSVSDRYDGDVSGGEPGAEPEPGHGSKSATVRFRVGGKVRFGCPCSNNNPKTPENDIFTVTNRGSAGLQCTSDKYNARLEIRLSENGIPRALQSSGAHFTVNQQWVDLSSEIEVHIPAGEATYLVSTFALRKDDEDDDKDCSSDLPDDLQDYLGISWGSVSMTDRLWTALCSTNYEAAEAVEFCVVGRCVEQILGVTSIPLRQPPGGPRLSETALISNIMMPQIVHVQSAL